MRFVALSLSPDVNLVAKAARGLNIRMEVAAAVGEVLAPPGVTKVPSTLFVMADGTIVAVTSGAWTRTFLEARMSEMLGK